MTTNSAAYLSNLHQAIDRYFNLEEIRTLCFDMGVDYDNVRGEGKSARIRELILAMARQERLQDLVDLVATQRPRVIWPPVPDDFELPASVASPTSGQTVQHNYYGDVIQGDKVGGDKVGGDKISVGNVSGSGIAIGRGASATVSMGEPTAAAGDFPGLNQTIKSNLLKASQAANSLPGADQVARATLRRLIVRLNDELQTLLSEKTGKAEEVSEATKLLVETAAGAEPNKTMVKMLAAGLVQAVQGLGGEAQAVTQITAEIVSAVSAAVGIS